MKFLLVLAFATCGFAFTVQRRWPGRIVGGSTASQGQFPYQVSIGYNGDHICGGSIIDSRTILTAAHCVDGYSTVDLIVIVGTNQINQGGNTHFITQLIMHENWNAPTATDDIGVIKLQNSIQFGQYVQAIAIANQVSDDGVDCVHSGWGITSYPSGDTPNDLQYFNAQVINLQECRNTFAGVVQYPIRDSNVCTFSRYGQGACKGDSGGPLVANNQQIGLTSWVISCAIGYPDVFTNVFYYRTWIQSNMG